jgi:hypothetical protein
VEAAWDAARTGTSWHRVFRVAHWPARTLHPGWLDPRLHETPGVRTLAVVMEPVPARASRRRVTADAATADTALALRERHAAHIPAPLARAHTDIDRRDAELHAGHPEYAYLGLLAVTAPTRTELDEAVADLAARCGIGTPHPLHGRHAHAWAATLPLGLAPRHTQAG